MIDARTATASTPRIPVLTASGARRLLGSSRPFALNHTSFPRRHHAATCRRPSARPRNRTKYNYFRDYDPSIGRYVQSDPLGINAGLNTYAYVTSNPLAFSDPEGLNPLIARGLAAALAAARAAKVAIEKSYNYCKNIRCRIAIHDAHHQFGWPFNRKMCHVQLNCWTKGVRGSGFALRFPYPCSWPGAGGAAGAGAGAGLGPDEQGEGDEQ